MNLYKLIFLMLILSNCKSDNKIPEVKKEGLEIKKIVNLSSEVNETSGLINFNGKLITHNDSGGKPYLYELDVVTGNILRTVNVSNAINKDIEDVAQDENYIYLCDIGNNSNIRKDQTIYKIKKSDYLSNDTVTAEKITIKYKEQVDFSSTSRSTNFDAEAVIAMGDNLFLFTKNWGNSKTSVYKIPKIKGDYEIEKTSTYNIEGLITGADYDGKSNSIILTGYADYNPFVVILSEFSQNNPFDGKVDKQFIIVSGSAQIEGVSVNPDGSYYVSAEQNSNLPAVLYRLIFN